MKKSELKALIRETIEEMDERTTGLKPSLKNQLDQVNAALTQLHAKFKAAVEQAYKDTHTDFELYLSVDKNGEPQMQIHAYSKDGDADKQLRISVPNLIQKYMSPRK